MADSVQCIFHSRLLLLLAHAGGVDCPSSPTIANANSLSCTVPTGLAISTDYDVEVWVQGQVSTASVKIAILGTCLPIACPTIRLLCNQPNTSSLHVLAGPASASGSTLKFYPLTGGSLTLAGTFTDPSLKPQAIWPATVTVVTIGAPGAGRGRVRR